MQNALKDLARRLANERRSPGKHAVHDDAQGPDVRPPVDAMVFPANLFRRHVANGANDFIRDLARFAVADCQTEIGNMRMVVVVEENVVWLDVTVHKSLIVGVCKGICDLSYQTRHSRMGRWVVFNQMRQPPSSYVLEHDKRGTGMTPHVEDGDNPRMLQPGCRPRFLGEPPPLLVAPKPVRARGLQGNQTIQLFIMRQEYVGESTSPKAATDGVSANPFGQRPITTRGDRISVTMRFRQFVFASMRFVVCHGFHMPGRKTLLRLLVATVLLVELVDLSPTALILYES
jgi:hypothetical protein